MLLKRTLQCQRTAVFFGANTALHRELSQIVTGGVTSALQTTAVVGGTTYLPRLNDCQFPGIAVHP